MTSDNLLAPAPAPIPRLLLTPRQAAEALGLSARTLWTLTKAGRIPAVKLDRAVRYAVADLQDFIEQNKKTAPVGAAMKGANNGSI